MSYITPNSTVYILKGVPLDSGYSHTVLQSSAAAQFTSFSSYIKYTLSNQTYQRAGKGRIRISKLCDDLYDCNYMIFRNTAYGNKWFYAFIKNPTYINDNCTELEYSIDVMQTWYFDYHMEHCYVEREHTLTDHPGDNLVDENINIGELVVQDTWKFTYPDSISPNGIMYEMVIFYVPNNTKKYIESVGYSGNDIVFTLADCSINNGTRYDTANIINGIYTGCKFVGIPMELGSTQTSRTRNLIDTTIAKILGSDVGGTIINIMQVPFNLYTDWLVNGGSTATRTVSHYASNRCYNSDGSAYYVPKNKKMFTYPFRSIVVSNNAGQTATYKWEYFTTPTPSTRISEFKITGVPITTPELMCYPHNYRKITNDYESGLMLTDFPTVSWNEDSFAKWWTQNKNSYITNLITAGIVGTATMGLALATGGAGAAAMVGAAATGTATSMIGNVARDIGSGVRANDVPDQISGQICAQSLRTIQNRIGFTFYEMGLEMSRARVIDDYFSMFGYAVKRVKIPNVRSTGVTLRPYWNYVKTNGCTINAASGSGLPADDERLINDIYDAGITFWNSMSNVGNYSLNNAPT